MSSINRVKSELEDLLELEDVEAVVLFRIDGSVIESSFDNNYTSRKIRVLQWCKDNVPRVSQEMRGNNLQKVTYELSDTCILFFAIGKIGILTTLANNTANLSLLAVETKRKASTIENYM
ncbi:MAG: hypothetical protein K9W46_09865 [Candidatus Heimdallarchaeum endolithica]|uniref:Roadblock/LAMTOR2 domain-containing protein n=1 Tax=Candidatus Heimdallarchaeum endolithica TaxID=2876572 RepID=A0A9Y1FN29_9ARCH|nr:MAG: hypothetical protein K9W46_09865 [Candidatus Heimdallarchaeum endolithica]